jgi:hypothetical protein
MIQKACIDRFEGKQAVLLVDDKPMVFPRSLLPRNARQGDWLQVEIEDERLVSAQLDPEETARTAKRIKEKLARLRRGEHR